MKIKNKNIAVIYDLLLGLELEIRQSRLRSRFARKIQEHFLTDYKADEDFLIEKFAIKKENGKVDFGENGGYTIPHESFKEYTKELNALKSECLEFELNDMNKEMLLTIYDLMFEETLKLTGEVALVHDELCEELELVKAFYDTK